MGHPVLQSGISFTSETVMRIAFLPLARRGACASSAGTGPALGRIGGLVGPVCGAARWLCGLCARPARGDRRRRGGGLGTAAHGAGNRHRAAVHRHGLDSRPLVLGRRKLSLARRSLGASACRIQPLGSRRVACRPRRPRLACRRLASLSRQIPWRSRPGTLFSLGCEGGEERQKAHLAMGLCRIWSIRARPGMGRVVRGLRRSAAACPSGSGSRTPRAKPWRLRPWR